MYLFIKSDLFLDTVRLLQRLPKDAPILIVRDPCWVEFDGGLFNVKLSTDNSDIIEIFTSYADDENPNFSEDLRWVTTIDRLIAARRAAVIHPNGNKKGIWFEFELHNRAGGCITFVNALTRSGVLERRLKKTTNKNL